MFWCIWPQSIYPLGCRSAPAGVFPPVSWHQGGWPRAALSADHRHIYSDHRTRISQLTHQHWSLILNQTGLVVHRNSRAVYYSIILYSIHRCQGYELRLEVNEPCQRLLFCLHMKAVSFPGHIHLAGSSMTVPISGKYVPQRTKGCTAWLLSACSQSPGQQPCPTTHSEHF